MQHLTLVDAAFWKRKLAEVGYEARPYCKSKKAFSAFAMKYAGFRIDPKPHVTITDMYMKLVNYISLQSANAVYEEARQCSR